MFRSDTFSSSDESKVKPTVQMISPTQLKLTVPSLKGAMSTKDTYELIKQQFGPNMPDSIGYAHETFFATYTSEHSTLNEFKILVELNNGDNLDHQILSPNTDGKIEPIVEQLHIPYVAFSQNCLLSEVYCCFRIAVKEELQRYSTAPAADVVSNAFARLSLKNQHLGRQQPFQQPFQIIDFIFVAPGFAKAAAQ